MQIPQFRIYLTSPNSFSENKVFIYFSVHYSQAVEKFNSKPHLPSQHLHYYTQPCVLSIQHTRKPSLNSPALSSPLAIQKSSAEIVNICQHHFNFQSSPLILIQVCHPSSTSLRLRPQEKLDVVSIFRHAT